MSDSEQIGSSTKFRAVLENVGLVAPVASTVLIEGETGTGKKVIAQAIHEASSWRNNRFRVSQLRGYTIRGIRGNSRNSRDSGKRDRDLSLFSFLFINLKMAGALLPLR